ncbi:glycosyltransferase [Saccharothrix sp. Mg75]|uniref:glycosyltransferase n=1 Tax=Saccharothrix sp. Mg75 TaxID=3445357 RepID=UPI003EEF7347
MKIAVVSAHANPLAVLSDAEAGGQDVHVAELAAALAKRGDEVVVHTRRDSAEQPEVVRTAHGFAVHTIPAGPPGPVGQDELLPHLEDFTRVLRGWWRADPPEVVHAHSWTSGLPSVLAARRIDVPVVQSFYELGGVERRGGPAVPSQRVTAERLIGREAKAVVASSSEEVADLVGAGVPRRRITLVPPAVDVRRFTPDGPRLARSLPHRIVVTADGAEEPISALRSVWDAELVVLGGAPAEVHRLREHAREVDVADRVRLVGRVSRAAMPSLLRSADLALCTTWDGTARTLPLEAMACGLPVVAASVGGLRDVVVDGVTGVLVPPNDATALVRTLRPLLADPARRGAQGSAGIDRAGSRYDVHRIAHATAGVYRRVTGSAEAGVDSRGQDGWGAGGQAG